jgi:MoaA/NifB/PqqE/SkfB family radical SAM enzyme
MQNHTIRLIAWETTRSCNLNCLHCRAAASKGPYAGELSTEESEKLLLNVASFAKPIIILTGGEPMLRKDIYHLAKFGNDLGLRMVMAPCGALLTEETCGKLKESGIQRISLSIDGATAKSHDAFR